MADIHAENTLVTISTIFRFHVKNKENQDDGVKSLTALIGPTLPYNWASSTPFNV